jgi:DNA mismatch repair protein MutL
VGRIRILSDLVANQIAAGEVVDRPASVVKELLENAIDAGATRIRIEVEGGGRKLIRITDNGSGMVRDDALLAFERHATSKVRTSSDLLTISTLGFRGEALPSIASISRLELATRTAEESAGTSLEIVGGKMHRVGEAGMPEGTMIAVRDLFFNTPARRKFLKSETTELSHVTALVTNYALAHPDKHFELHSATHALLIAPPVAQLSERVYQIFGKETLDHLIPIAAEINLSRVGLPEPLPWKRDADYAPPEPGHLRIHGLVSKPSLQKLNRNSMYSFVNQRLVRERVIIHAITEAYRNIMPPTSFPVVLLFLEMPPGEVDVNVHPAKTEVRFRQPSLVHDFVRDSIRTKLVFARPAMSFGEALETNPLASPSLGAHISPAPSALIEQSQIDSDPLAASVALDLTPAPIAPVPGRLDFATTETNGTAPQAPPDDEAATLKTLGTLKALGQLRESFILATNEEGLWTSTSPTSAFSLRRSCASGKSSRCSVSACSCLCSSS